MKSIFLVLNLCFTTPLLSMEVVKLPRGAKVEGLLKSCHLHLSFGSYGSGTPHKVIKKINQFLKEREDQILKNTTWSWGKEGEFDYCLVLADKSQIDDYFRELKKFIPLYSKKGYTTLKDRSGKIHKTTWPKS